MKAISKLLTCTVFLFTGLFMDASSGAAQSVIMETNKGNIEIELDAAKAPGTVKNFLSYVDNRFYEGTIFHRVIKGFMIQGGGFTPDMKQKGTNAPIKIESNNGLKNMRGTIAMARTQDPNSATSQFFINTVDNAFLNYSNNSMQGIGYTVFGKVTAGMDAVEAIERSQTGTVGGYEDVPVEPVKILAVRRK